ncbi:hypothetical protein [Mesorhizobium sp. CA4]|uniref:hypothetical protein n=1 Tax=Mesorhizobium sp. CA4 TaxID=588499 RepID=UPI001CD0B115|nr:hypothetical protein [Mesorhizobium sp. CA4]MBZ9821976.1 hypothetical protein [Mesorhizobium sp. CA4]
MWETAATATALSHRVVDLRGHDQLPGILIQQADNRLLDLLFGDDVAMADQHLLALADGAVPAPLGWFLN